MYYCKVCSTPILQQWEGWPLHKPVPLLPRIIDGHCESCRSQAEPLAHNAIQWLNHHGPFNTGLPDYWVLIINRDSFWGLPYYSESNCEECGSRAVISEHGRADNGHFKYKLGCISCDEREQERKRAALQRQMDREAAALRRRQVYLASLAARPFAERIAAIACDPSICNARNWREWQEWSGTWRQYSVEELHGFGASEIQQLIDLCENNSTLRSLGVLQPLYDRRHELRQAAIAEIRAKYSTMSIQDQLTALVVSSTTPISHFPIELADAVTDEWLATIPTSQKERFLSDLRDCKLRVWMKAYRRLYCGREQTKLRQEM